MLQIRNQRFPINAVRAFEFWCVLPVLAFYPLLATHGSEANFFQPHYCRLGPLYLPNFIDICQSFFPSGQPRMHAFRPYDTHRPQCLVKSTSDDNITVPNTTVTLLDAILEHNG